MIWWHPPEKRSDVDPTLLIIKHETNFYFDARVSYCQNHSFGREVMYTDSEVSRQEKGEYSIDRLSRHKALKYKQKRVGTL